MSTAAAIHAAACAVLSQRGERPTQARVAELVGEPAPHWSLYVSGRRAPGAEKVQAWLQAWRDAGFPAMVVEVGADTVTARVEAQ